ncbi:MAG: HEAT repeat domain-containing protein [Anaerolineae bacterium]
MVDFDPRIFKALRSDDPEERKKGVRALAQTGEKEAMRYLATIYQKDPDPSVRQLALDAGKHIKQLRLRGDWVGEGFKNPKQAEPQYTSTVPEADQKLSKKYMDDALELVVSEAYDRAEALAVKAFALNPDLRHDPYYSSLASEVMGMPTAQAIQTIMTRVDEQREQ